MTPVLMRSTEGGKPVDARRLRCAVRDSDAWRRFKSGCSRLAADIPCNIGRAMNRTLRHLLVAAALVFTQQAAQLHALSHLQRGLVMAERGGKCVPPVNHPAEQCIAYHAVDSALPGFALAVDLFRTALPAVAPVALRRPCSRALQVPSRSHELGETTCTERQPWRSPSRRRWACPTPRLRRRRTSSGPCASKSGTSTDA